METASIADIAKRLLFAGRAAEALMIGERFGAASASWNGLTPMKCDMIRKKKTSITRGANLGRDESPMAAGFFRPDQGFALYCKVGYSKVYMLSVLRGTLETEPDLDQPARSRRGYVNGSTLEPASALDRGSAPHELTTQRSPPKRILIVEDNELNLKLLKDILEFHGYTIISTALGATALDLAREHVPDLILLDIRLPDISGIEAARRLKADEQAHAIPIIAVTAFAMPGDRATILDSGCDDYISKPFNLQTILALIDRYTNKAAASKRSATALG